MCKESRNDRRSLVGTRTSKPRAQLHSENSFMRNARIVGFCFVVLLIGICARTNGVYSQSDNSSTVQGAAGEPYPIMPSIAPIGVKIDKYMDVPASSQGPTIDPAKGYRLQDLGKGLYMITDNAIQSLCTRTGHTGLLRAGRGNPKNGLGYVRWRPRCAHRHSC